MSAPLGSTLVVGILIFVTACGPKTPAPDSRADAGESPDALRADVLQLVGEPACSDVSQCRSIAFGSKPCGGPWSYLVYSVQTADSARLATAVANYNARETQLNRDLGRASDCRMVTAPRLDCVASRCTTARN